jgi:hypothetical protein
MLREDVVVCLLLVDFSVLSIRVCVRGRGQWFSARRVSKWRGSTHFADMAHSRYTNLDLAVAPVFRPILSMSAMILLILS